MATYDGTRYAVQCKSQDRPVGNKAVQQVVAARQFYGVQRCAVIVDGTYTEAAHALARRTYCVLFSVRDLQTAATSGNSLRDLIAGHRFSDIPVVDHDYDLIRNYEKVKSTLGHTPRNKDFDKTTRHRIRKRYGNLSTLIASVGDSPYSRRPSDESIIEEYKRVRETLGAIPTLEDMKDHSRFSRNCFSSFPFTKLQRMCGDRPHVERGVTKKDLVDAFKELQGELGRTPTITDLDEKGMFRASYYRRRWGSMERFRETLGISPRTLGQRSYDRNELIVLYLLLANALSLREGDRDHPVNQTILEKVRFAESVFVSPSTYSRRFGSWKSFMERMGDEDVVGLSRDLEAVVRKFLDLAD